MSVTEGVKHYTSHQDYLQRARKGDTAPSSTKSLDEKQLPAKSDRPGEVKPAEPTPPGADPATVVELSEELSDTDKVKDLGKKALNALKTPGVPQLPLMAMNAVKDIKPPDWDSSPDIKQGPGIYFISGFKVFSSSNGDGIEEMAQHLEGAKHFSWKNEQEILEDIVKRDPNEPIVLVGHSLGGNAAVKIARQLNSAAFNFRPVDLLVTMDSFGFNNDVIPTNVKKNLNFIGHQNIFLNDGPNIARDAERTLVLNELRDEMHTRIDNAPDVQEKVYQRIAGAVEEAQLEALSALNLGPETMEIIIEFEV